MLEEIQQEYFKPGFLLKTFIRRRWLLILPLLAALGVGSYFAITLPKVYEAQTLILIQPQRVPTEYVQSVVTDVDERIDTLSQQILSRSNLEQIIRQFNLFSGAEAQGMFTEDMVASLRERITVEVTRNRRETNAFTITYRDQDQELVMRVTNALATYFIDENLKVREAQAIGTSDFLEAELSAMRERLEQQERAVESFRSTNMGELPEQLETNLRILDRLQEQLIERQEGLRDARSRLASLQNQAAAGLLAAQQAGDAASAGPDPLNPDALRAELARLESRYTDKHPDIIKLKQQIRDLEASGASSGGEAGPQRREPVQITDVRREIQNISDDIARIRAEIGTYEQRVEMTPKREQELMALQRDYQNLQESYSSLLNRKLEADIAVNMERKQKGEQFRVLDRARLPQRPVEPNMKKLFLFTVAAGLGIGGALIVLLEFTNTSFRLIKEVELTLGLPAIATIPHIENPRKRAMRWINRAVSGVALIALVGTFGFFSALTFKGVDQTLSLVSKVKNVIF